MSDVKPVAKIVYEVAVEALAEVKTDAIPVQESAIAPCSCISGDVCLCKDSECKCAGACTCIACNAYTTEDGCECTESGSSSPCKNCRCGQNCKCINCRCKSCPGSPKAVNVEVVADDEPCKCSETGVCRCKDCKCAECTCQDCPAAAKESLESETGKSTAGEADKEPKECQDLPAAAEESSQTAEYAAKSTETEACKSCPDKPGDISQDLISVVGLSSAQNVGDVCNCAETGACICVECKCTDCKCTTCPGKSAEQKVKDEPNCNSTETETCICKDCKCVDCKCASCPGEGSEEMIEVQKPEQESCLCSETGSCLCIKCECEVCPGKLQPEEKVPQAPTPDPKGEEKVPQAPTPDPKGEEKVPQAPTPDPKGEEKVPQAPTPDPKGEEKVLPAVTPDPKETAL